MKALFACFLICLMSSAYAQNKTKDEPVFYAVEQQAEFPGGIDSLMSFLRKNTIYPSRAKKNGIEGKVFVKMIVEKDGTLSELEVMKGVNPQLDKEALRVVSTSPAWIPAQQGGKIVRSQYVLPIYFKLDN